MTIWQIKKLRDNLYEVGSGDHATHVEEDVNSSKLLGMLYARGLSIIQIGVIVGSLHSQVIGVRTTIEFAEKVVLR